MSLKQIYKRNCRSPLLRPFISLGKSLNRYYENLNYDHRSNGEERTLRVLSQFPVSQVFDVGANQGSWVSVAKQIFPNAKFTCFEPVPQVYSLLKAHEEPNRIVAINSALGSSNSVATFHHFEDGHALSSFYEFKDHKEKATVTEVQVKRGDDFMAEQRIDRIDILKIDTEGHDLEVLKGFESALREHRIGAIQFEYGKINIVSRALLRDFYELLIANSYVIGKIYPKRVVFSDYRFEMEDFIGPNFLAVPAKNLALIAALSGGNAD